MKRDAMQNKFLCNLYKIRVWKHFTIFQWEGGQFHVCRKIPGPRVRSGHGPCRRAPAAAPPSVHRRRSSGRAIPSASPVDRNSIHYWKYIYEYKYIKLISMWKGTDALYELSIYMCGSSSFWLTLAAGL